MKKIVLTAAIICGAIATAFAGHFGPRPEPPRHHHKPAVRHHAKPEVRPAAKVPPKGPAKPEVKKNHHQKENHHRR